MRCRKRARVAGNVQGSLTFTVQAQMKGTMIGNIIGFAQTVNILMKSNVKWFVVYSSASLIKVKILLDLIYQAL